MTRRVLILLLLVAAMRGDLNLLTPSEAGMLIGRGPETIRAWLRDEKTDFRSAVVANIPSTFATISLPKLARFILGDEDGERTIPEWRERIAEFRATRRAERKAS